MFGRWPKHCSSTGAPGQNEPSMGNWARAVPTSALTRMRYPSQRQSSWQRRQREWRESSCQPRQLQWIDGTRPDGSRDNAVRPPTAEFISRVWPVVIQREVAVYRERVQILQTPAIGERLADVVAAVLNPLVCTERQIAESRRDVAKRAFPAIRHLCLQRAKQLCLERRESPVRHVHGCHWPLDGAVCAGSAGLTGTAASCCARRSQI